MRFLLRILIAMPLLAVAVYMIRGPWWALAVCSVAYIMMPRVDE